jgi:hypothetical protein
MKHIYENKTFITDQKLKKILYDYDKLLEDTKYFVYIMAQSNGVDFDDNYTDINIKEMWYAKKEHYIGKKSFENNIPVFEISYEFFDINYNLRLNEQQYEEYLLYLSDPELYKSLKKYNL